LEILVMQVEILIPTLNEDGLYELKGTTPTGI
jgi:hypothetical protein